MIEAMQPQRWQDGASRAGGRGRRGTLVLVVGPSGAGKETLIAAAAAARPDIYVARQVVTGSPGGASRGLSPAAFEALRRAGRLALDWQAQGRRFGLRAELEPRLAAGQHVLARAGRSAIPAARARYAPCRVLVVTAPAPVLEARLAGRGRPALAEAPAGPPLLEAVTVENAGPLEAALARFIAALPPRREDAG